MGEVEEASASGAARWRGLIEDQGRSGLSIQAFCAARGLRVSTYYEWRRRLAVSATLAPAFLPVQVTEARPAPGSGVEVVLCGGGRVRVERGFDPAVLVAVVAALEGGPC